MWWSEKEFTRRGTRGVGSHGTHAQNRIVVIPGANRTLTVEEVAWIQQAVSGFDMVLLQLEVPIE